MLSTSVVNVFADDHDSTKLVVHSMVQGSTHAKCFQVSKTLSSSVSQSVLASIYDYLNDDSDEYVEHEVPVVIAVRNFCNAELRIWSPDHSVYFTSNQDEEEVDEEEMHEQWFTQYH